MTPYLYILMRTDLPSMNPGKAMAQASHASNAFVGKIRDNKLTSNKEFETWQKETPQHFGTAIVLGVTGIQLEKTIGSAKLKGFIADNIIDPEYHYKVNGEIAKLLNPSEAHIFEGNKEYNLFRREVTCGYIFGDKEDIAATKILADLKLHP